VQSFKESRDYPKPGQVTSLSSLLDPEPYWLRIAMASHRFGLSRSHLFKLIAEGKVESKHVKHPGAKRGIRIISTSSLKKYVNSF
jgi:hypothetical protein